MRGFLLTYRVDIVLVATTYHQEGSEPTLVTVTSKQRRKKACSAYYRNPQQLKFFD